MTRIWIGAFDILLDIVFAKTPRASVTRQKPQAAPRASLKVAIITVAATLAVVEFPVLLMVLMRH